MAGGNFGGGNGTQGNPYLVEDLADLGAVGSNMEAHYLQVNDIISGSMNPIGFQGNYLKGSYDGGLCVINNIVIKGYNSLTDFAGLFVGIEGGRVKNIIMENCRIEGFKDSGGIAGNMLGGTIEQCCVIDTEVTSIDFSGHIVGVVGTGNNNIKECFSINTTSNSRRVLSGIAGTVYSGNISDCYYRNYGNASVISGIASTLGDQGYMSNSYSSFRGGAYPISSQAINPPSDCYYDAEFSGLTGGYGIGKSTAEMKRQETFIGWDFVNTWGIDENINDGYPYLRWYPYDLAEEFLNLYAKKNNTWHKAKDLYAKKNGIWSKAKDLYGNKQGWNKSE